MRTKQLFLLNERKIQKGFQIKHLCSNYFLCLLFFIIINQKQGYSAILFNSEKHNNFNSVNIYLPTQDTVYAPSIDVQPQNNAIIENDTAIFSVSVSGSSPFSYHWYKNDTILLSWANQATLIIDSAKTSDAGTYKCVVSNEYGSNTSNIATLLVCPPPNILALPKDTILCFGSSVSFSISATSIFGPLSYQWKKSNNIILYATSSIYTIPNITTSDSGRYTCVLTDQCNDTSFTALLQVDTLPIITIQPIGGKVCPGQNFTMRIFNKNFNNNSYCRYQWYKNDTILFKDTIIDMINDTIGKIYNDSITFSHIITSDSGYYKCILTNECGSITSNIVVLNIDSLILTKQPESLRFCYNTDPNGSVEVNYSVEASGSSNIHYQWYYIYMKIDPVTGHAVQDTLPYSGINTNLLHFEIKYNDYQNGDGDPDDGFLFYCIISDSCYSIKSRDAMMIVDNPPDLHVPPITIFRCLGDSLILSNTPTGISPFTYQWFKNTDTIHGATESFLNINPITYEDSGTYFCSISNICGSLSPFQIATLMVYDSIYITHQPKDTIACLGTNISFSTESSDSTNTYQWYKNDTIIQNANSRIYILDSISNADAGIYYCVIHPNNICNNITTNNASLSVVNCLSGKITYDKTSDTPLSNVNIFLFNTSGDTLDSAITDSEGKYYFLNRTTGQYKIKEKTDKEWGGVLPNDALMVNKYYIGLVTSFLNPLREEAADVNIDDKINPQDALLINKRYIGTVTRFLAGDWLFDTNDDSLYYEVSNYVDIKGLCTGDVNGDYNPPLKKGFFNQESIAFSMFAENNFNFNNFILPDSGVTRNCIVAMDSIFALQDSNIVIQLRVDSFNFVGAFGFKIQYDTTALEFAGIENVDSNLIAMIHARQQNNLNFAWVSNGDSILSLDSTVILNLKFNYLGGNTALTFLPASVVSDYYGDSFNVTYKNGYISQGYIPTITTQPQSNTICENDSVTFTIIATGTPPPTYQWLHNNEQLAMNNEQLKIDTITEANAGYYKCVASNIFGNVVSDSVLLTVSTPPVITDQLVEDTVCWGTPIILSVTATGSVPFTYEWFKDESYVSSDSTYDATYDYGGTYNYVITNACGTDTSNIAVIHSAYAAPTIYSEDLGDFNWNTYSYEAIKCDSSEITFTIGAYANGNVPLSYQWYKNDTILIQGAIDSLLTISNLALADSGFYKCVVMNICDSTTSSISHLIIHSDPVIGQQPLPDTLCILDTKTFTVEATGTGTLYYQWKLDNVDITDATDSSYYIESIETDDAGVYSCAVTDDCGTVLSDTARLTVMEPQTTALQCYDMGWYGDFFVDWYGYIDEVWFDYYEFVSSYEPAWAIAAAIAYQINNANPQLFTAVVCEGGIVYIKPIDLCKTYSESCTYGYLSLTSNPSPPPCNFNSRLMSDNITKEINTSINVYPNPNDGSFTLDVQLPYDGNVRIEAYGILGNIVLSEQYYLKMGDNKLNLKINNVQPGIYFINVKTDKETFYRKMIVE